MAGGGEAAGVRERARARATERELVIVAAVLEAGSEKAAAHRLGLSRSTVKDHLASARSKVGATTTAQLVWPGTAAAGAQLRREATGPRAPSESVARSVRTPTLVSCTHAGLFGSTDDRIEEIRGEPVQLRVPESEAVLAAVKPSHELA